MPPFPCLPTAGARTVHSPASPQLASKTALPRPCRHFLVLLFAPRRRFRSPKSPRRHWRPGGTRGRRRLAAGQATQRQAPTEADARASSPPDPRPRQPRIDGSTVPASSPAGQAGESERASSTPLAAACAVISTVLSSSAAEQSRREEQAVIG